MTKRKCRKSKPIIGQNTAREAANEIVALGNRAAKGMTLSKSRRIYKGHHQFWNTALYKWTYY